jgi:hypothetical protein
MASIYDQPPLSPAQLTKRLIEQARERAEKEEWEQYEEENRRLNGIRFKPTRAKPTKHGTRQGYGKGCRCDPCKKANSDYLKEYRLRKGITKSNRDGRKYAHGTYYSYQYGKCRCDLCSEAGRIHREAYRIRDNERRRRKRAEDAEYRERLNAYKREWDRKNRKNK